jgi:hypothetical protein
VSDIKKAVEKLLKEENITLDQLSNAVKKLEKESNILCETSGDEPLTLHDIDSNFIGRNALNGIEDYSIVDYDNHNDYTLHRVHINHERKTLEFEFVDNPAYKKRILRQ